MTVKFVAPRVPLVDLRTGTITREWYLLLQGLFTGSGVDNADIAMVAPAAPLDVALATIARMLDDERQRPEPMVVIIDDPQLPPPIPDPWREALVLLGSIRDEIAMLRSMIEDLEKGPL